MIQYLKAQCTLSVSFAIVTADGKPPRKALNPAAWRVTSHPAPDSSLRVWVPMGPRPLLGGPCSTSTPQGARECWDWGPRWLSSVLELGCSWGPAYSNAGPWRPLSWPWLPLSGSLCTILRLLGLMGPMASRPGSGDGDLGAWEACPSGSAYPRLKAREPAAGGHRPGRAADGPSSNMCVTQYLSFCVGLISRNTMSLKFIHAVAGVGMSFFKPE